MAQLIVFGGTTEGRLLSEWAAEKGIATVVCTATSYGGAVLKNLPKLEIQEGRLNTEEMERLFFEKKPELILDATHPHAVLVTENIKKAAQAAQIRYLRVCRSALDVFPEKTGDVRWVKNAGEAVQELLKDQQPVLLTTGSKELLCFAEHEELRERLYARVLPTEKVIHECENLGLKGRQILAMQGPFSMQMNCAMLKETRAGWLVTKESGAAGGFCEKLEAAAQCGVKTIVIQRPDQESGISLEEAKSFLSQQFEIHPVRTISMIGMGMGAGHQLTMEAVEALKRSELVFGAGRMLKDVASFIGNAARVEKYLGSDILDHLEKHPEYETISIVCSGDTGYHSAASSFVDELNKRNLQDRVRMFPGISTVSCLCARFCRSWEELYLASAHGASCDIVQLVKEHKKVFLLLDKENTVPAIAEKLLAAGYGNVMMQVGARLGYEDEHLAEGTAAQMVNEHFDGLAAVILERR